jgi:hypothetical protein
VGIARGNEKGRVERRIRDIRESFFAARSFSSIDDLNRQLDAWLERVVHARIVPGKDSGTVAEALLEEKARLLPLPEHRFDPCHTQAVASGKTPYVRFDRNDYSIPHTLVRKPLTLVASDTVVRILDRDVEVARHQRSWDARQQLEDESHLAALAREKRKARDHRGRNRLTASCPAAEPFLVEVLRHGGHLGGTTTRLLHLLERYGASEIDVALAEAHARGAFAAQSVAHILDRRARARGEQPPLDVVLPDDPRVRDLVVTPHDLGCYDQLSDDSFDVEREGDE